MGRRKTPSPVKRRKPLHEAPLLRKFEAHGKTRKTQWKNDNVALFPAPVAKLDKAADFYSADLRVRVLPGVPVAFSLVVRLTVGQQTLTLQAVVRIHYDLPTQGSVAKR